MKTLHHGGQTLGIHVRVYLRRADVGVAEKFLNNADRGSAGQKMGSKRVAQPVRRNLLWQPGGPDVTLHGAPDGGAGKRTPLPVNEHPRLSGSRPERIAHRAKPRANCGLGPRSKRNKPVLSALTAHSNHAFVKPDSVDGKRGDFAFAKTAPVEQFKNGPVPDAFRRVRGWGVHEPCGGVRRNHVRKNPPSLRKRDGRGWIGRYPPLVPKPREKTPDGSQASGPRGDSKPVTRLGVEKLGDVRRADSTPLDGAAPFGKKRRERPHVARVCLARGGGKSAFPGKTSQP